MRALLRKTVAVLVAGGMSVTAAASPGPGVQEGFSGAWITWWDAGGTISPCSRLDVVAEDQNTLDGMWAEPGFNGLLHGTVQQTRAGVRWEGEWRDTEGGFGTFRFIRGAPGAGGESFEGVYTAGGGDEELMWNGVRLVEGRVPDAPCVFAG